MQCFKIICSTLAKNDKDCTINAKYYENLDIYANPLNSLAHCKRNKFIDMFLFVCLLLHNKKIHIFLGFRQPEKKHIGISKENK